MEEWDAKLGGGMGMGCKTMKSQRMRLALGRKNAYSTLQGRKVHVYE